MPESKEFPRPPDVIVVVGGAPEGVVALPSPGASTIVVAADSGLHFALAAGLSVHHVVGDLDSVDPAVLVAAEAAGVTVHRHPSDKDATDLELALELVLDLAGSLVTVVDRPLRLHVAGPGSGRLDLVLGDLLLLAGPRLADVDVTASFGSARVAVVRPGRTCTVQGAVDEVISLIPAHGPARGVHTAGLWWQLLDADLVPGTTRGVSNQFASTEATVSIGSGVVLAVQPGIGAPPVVARATPYDPTPRDPEVPR